MLRGVVGTENTANEYETKNVGRWIFSSDKWKLPSLVRKDKSQNKLMSSAELLKTYNYGQSREKLKFAHYLGKNGLKVNFINHLGKHCFFLWLR